MANIGLGAEASNLQSGSQLENTLLGRGNISAGIGNVAQQVAPEMTKTVGGMAGTVAGAAAAAMNL